MGDESLRIRHLASKNDFNERSNPRKITEKFMVTVEFCFKTKALVFDCFAQAFNC